jgi:hypothetical protein
MNIENLENKIVNAEYFLCKMGSIPIINTVAGITKVALGSIQTVGSTFLIAFSLPILFSLKGRNTLKKGANNLIDGIVNIIFGALITIPIAGELVANYRINFNFEELFKKEYKIVKDH